MKILVTGTEGYLGSLLAPLLMEAGHDLLAVDTGFYKSGWLYQWLVRHSAHAEQGYPVRSPVKTSPA